MNFQIERTLECPALAMAVEHQKVSVFAAVRQIMDQLSAAPAFMRFHPLEKLINLLRNRAALCIRLSCVRRE